MILTTVGLQATALITPLLLRSFVNILASSHPNPDVTHHLFAIVGFLAAIWFVEWLLNRIEYTSEMRLFVGVMSDLITDAFDYLIGHSYNFFTSNFAGSLTVKVSKFSRSFEILMNSIINEFFPTFLFVVGAVTILFINNHVLGSILGMWAIFFTAFQIIVARLRQPSRIAAAEAETHVTATLADSISNHMTTLLFAGEKAESKLLQDVVDVRRKAVARIWIVDNYIWSAFGIFTAGINIALLYGATVYWSRGLLTVGDFVLIQSYLLSTFTRLISINRTFRRFFDAIADAQEMVSILQESHGIQDAAHAPALIVSEGTIRFNHVGFHFNTSQDVLSDFNLTINAGEKVALVGPSGAGKSTITKLLLRMYDVDSGSIEFDGQTISEVTQESLRSAIGFVPQEPILFHRSLMENIRYGRRDAGDQHVIEAAKKAHCHEFISRLPDGYATLVGERGIKLSGGERQRVAIARAILKNAPILILDEATSSLDSESESLIQDSLKILMEGKTVLVIAHRLSTIMKMDRIIVLEGGMVVADGTHSELLEHGGLYKKLWSIQAGGFIKDEEEDE